MGKSTCIFCGHDKFEHGAPICGVQNIDVSRFPPTLSDPCPCEKIGIIKFPESLSGMSYQSTPLTCEQWWERRNPKPRWADQSYLRRFLNSYFAHTYRGFAFSGGITPLWQSYARRGWTAPFY